MSDLLYQGVTDQAVIESLDAQIKSLTDTAPYMYLASIIERVIAITYHICASVLVYAAARRGKAWLYPVTVLIHALYDGAIVVIASTGLNTFIVEGILAAMTALIVILAVKVYKGMEDIIPSPEPAVEDAAEYAASAESAASAAVAADTALEQTTEGKEAENDA